MTTYEKIVKGATKVKIAAPKPKYIEPILMATLAEHSSEIEDFHTIMKTLQSRLQDSSWSVVYKLLIVIHIMIREGEKDVVLDYINKHIPGMLNLSGSHINRHGSLNLDVRYLMKYAKYLNTRVKQFDTTGIDYVRDERSSNRSPQSGGRLRSIGIEKGLLRESESVQKQIDALLKSNFMENEITNDILLTAFRLLVNDLLALFQELNEGVINILEHYFEMSKVDAERALKIYKKFVDQTKFVIDFLRVAKHLEHATKLHVPTIKHAPTALTSSLEEYLNDPNFESNRRQYLAEKKFSNNNNNTLPKSKEDIPLSAKQDINSNHSRNDSLLVQQTTTNPWLNAGYQFQNGQLNSANGVLQLSQQYLDTQTGAIYSFQTAPHNQNLELNNSNQGLQNPQFAQPIQSTNSQTLNSSIYNPQQQFQQNITARDTSNLNQPNTGLQPLNNGFTGNGFGGYGPQLNSQVTGTNPFMNNSVNVPNFSTQNTNQFQQGSQGIAPNTNDQYQRVNLGHVDLTKSNTNPFAKMNSASNTVNTTATGSNPFASTRFSLNSGTTELTFNKATPEPIAATTTGSNPFKVSQTTSNLFDRVADQNQNNLHNQKTLKPQPTAGGLENIPTIPLFPLTKVESEKQAYLNNARLAIQLQGTGFQQTPAGFQQAPTGFQQAPTGFQQAPTGFQQAPTGFQQAPTGFQQAPFGYAQQYQQQNGVFPHNTSSQVSQGGNYDGPSLI